MNIENIRLRGMMAARAAKNFSRLEDDLFTPDSVLSDKTYNNGWPGDREGRIMLALTLHERLSGRESAYLHEYFVKLPHELNSQGYRGEVMGDAVVEQSLAGHNWLLRALLENYDYRKDETSLCMAQTIADNLYKPLAGRYATYPVQPSQRNIIELEAGVNDGHVIDGWQTSTDVGCAFISLDALSQYYKFFGDAEIGALVEEMIGVFSEIDFVGLNMQTHATLSALRGIARMYRVTGKTEYIETVKRIFGLYMSEGMTENYENYNWFGRPSWTEPCAVVDSYIVAMELFNAYGDEKYAEIANRILYSGLLRGQRANGGFGCNTCLGAGNEPFVLRNHLPEAHWCCSMRGAEGFAQVAANAVLFRDDTCVITNFMDGVYTTDELRLEIETRYPYEGRATIRLNSNGTIKKLRLIPAKDASITLDGARWSPDEHPLPSGEHTLNIEFQMNIERRSPVGKHCVSGVHSLWRGPVILGCNETAGMPDDANLTAVMDVDYHSDGERLKALFVD